MNRTRGTQGLSLTPTASIYFSRLDQRRTLSELAEQVSIESRHGKVKTYGAVAIGVRGEVVAFARPRAS